MDTSYRVTYSGVWGGLSPNRQDLASMHYNNEDASTQAHTTSLNKFSKNWKMKLGLNLYAESGWNMSGSYMREHSIDSSNNSKSGNNFSFSAGMKF